MKLALRASRALLVTSLSIASLGDASPALAHGGAYPPSRPPPPPPAGGTYNGPGDTPPPAPGRGPGNAGPSTPGPNGPAAPGGSRPRGPTSPGSPGPAAPNAPRPPTSSGGSGPDPSAWSWWWNYNRDPYLDLWRHVQAGNVVSGSDDFFLGYGQRSRASSLAPREQSIRSRIGPALQKAVESGSWRMQSDAMLAVAKLYPIFEPEGKSIVELIAPQLSAPNQKLAESAVVALGLTGAPECVEILADIGADTAAGRKWIERSSVPGRTRPLALLSLGVLGRRLRDEDDRARLNAHLRALLEGPEGPSPDLHVASVTSIGLTPLALAGTALEPDTAPEPGALTSREQQVRFLLRVLREENRHEYVRAHAPKALALLTRDATRELRDSVKAALLDELARRKRRDRMLRYGLVDALGVIADADEDEIDVRVRAVLHDSVRDGNNDQRALSIMALALSSSRAGEGDEPFAALAAERKYLLGQLARGKSRLRPWSALALGIQEYHATRAGEPPCAAVFDALLASYESTRSPEDAGAYSIALGLVGDPRAQEQLLEHMQNSGDDFARGYAAVGLGLLGSGDSIPALLAMLEDSRYRPVVLRQAAVGLALLGHKSVVTNLLKALEVGKTAAVKSAAIAALGLVGDSRVVDPLVNLLEDSEQLDVSRSFAAIALGVACERDPLPWTADFSNHLNYFALTETLFTGKGTGIMNLR